MINIYKISALYEIVKHKTLMAQDAEKNTVMLSPSEVHVHQQNSKSATK